MIRGGHCRMQVLRRSDGNARVGWVFHKPVIPIHRGADGVAVSTAADEVVVPDAAENAAAPGCNTVAVATAAAKCTAVIAAGSIVVANESIVTIDDLHGHNRRCYFDLSCLSGLQRNLVSVKASINTASPSIVATRTEASGQGMAVRTIQLLLKLLQIIKCLL